MVVKLDTGNLGTDLQPMLKRASAAYAALVKGECGGADMRGWLKAFDDGDELRRIEDEAHRIRETADALVVIGIGGSYLGSRAALDFVRSPYYNLMPKNTPDIYFAGTALSGCELSGIIAVLGDRDFCVNVISKSGSTMEPAAAFQVFRRILEKRYGRDGAAERITVTTDAKNGDLRREAEAEGWRSFAIPNDVGGRYSVLTPVGLLPMAAAGIDIRAALAGAGHVLNDRENIARAIEYAAARKALGGSGKMIEIFAAFEPALRMLGEWWKQLFGESEGKNGGGIFPASVMYSTDLHSIGQLVQDGPRTIFETFVMTESVKSGVAVPEDAESSVSLIAGMKFDDINRTAYEAARSAHYDGGVPNMTISVPERSAETFGALVAFFEVACAVSCIMDGVNPFDQPGVEAYKRNMRELLKR